MTPQVDYRSRGEYLEQFNIRRRVQVELTDFGILIRPPEEEHHSHEHGQSSGEQEPAEPETSEAILQFVKGVAEFSNPDSRVDPIMEKSHEARGRFRDPNKGPVACISI